MKIQTLTLPTADEQQVKIFNRDVKKSNVAVIELDTKYAMVLIKLNPVVSQPGDYAALKTAVEAVTGIVEVSLLIDTHGTPASIPAGKELRLVAEAHIRIDDAPEE